jgi:hypothetical protein
MIDGFGPAEEFLVSSPPPTRVRFRIEDVLHPNGTAVLWELYRGQALHGELLAVTDDGREPGNFLVLRVPGVHEPVLLPAAKALPHNENGQQSGGGSLTAVAEKTAEDS